MLVRSIFKISLVLVVVLTVTSLVGCQETEASPAATEEPKADEPVEEEEKKSCGIWCWIQKIALFVVSQLLSG